MVAPLYKNISKNKLIAFYEILLLGIKAKFDEIVDFAGGEQLCGVY